MKELFIDFFCGSAASVFAVCFTNPIDMMRTRMQLQGDLCKHGEYERLYRNIAQGLYRVAREEGLMALQKGLVASMLWQIAQNGLRIGLYPGLKRSADTACGFGSSYMQDHGVLRRRQARCAGEERFVSCVLAGAASGGIGAFVSSPFNLVKTRLQSQRSPSEMRMLARMGQSPASPSTASSVSVKSTGVQHGYRGVRDALGSLYRAGGIRGLWHGSKTGAKLIMCGSAVQLVSYDYASRFIVRHVEASRRRSNGGSAVSSSSPIAKDPRVHCAAALLSAVVLVCIMNPFNVVMTRIYNHHAQSGVDQLYIGQSMSASVKMIHRTEGLVGCYKGSGAMFGRVAPHVMLTFVMYEWLRSEARERVKRIS